MRILLAPCQGAPMKTGLFSGAALPSRRAGMGAPPPATNYQAVGLKIGGRAKECVPLAAQRSIRESVARNANWMIYFRAILVPPEGTRG